MNKFYDSCTKAQIMLELSIENSTRTKIKNNYVYTHKSVAATETTMKTYAMAKCLNCEEETSCLDVVQFQ